MADDYEKKRISIITLTGGMIGSVGSMLVGSYFGAAGTLYGAAVGSGASAVLGTLWENSARRTHAKLKARREQEEVERTTISPLMREKLMQERETFIARREQDILRQQRRDPWKIATVTLGSLMLFALVALGTLLGIEKATGQTLHSAVTGAKQYGTSFSYSTVRPRASVTPSLVPSSPVPSSSIASPGPDASPDASPDQAPGGVPSTIGLTGTPTSSASATSSPSEQTAPAVNAVPSSSSATGLSAAGTTDSRRRREGAWRVRAREDAIMRTSSL